MSQSEKPVNLDAAELARWLNSAEYAISKDVERIGQGYACLVNAQTAAEAKDGLASLRAAAADTEKRIRHELNVHGCPVGLILNINKIAMQKWTLDTLSGLWINAAHMLNRFIHATSDESKVKQLTQLYHLIRDLAECALEIDAENYRKEQPFDLHSF